MKISIITVVLNGEKTIERTVQSVINQDFAGEIEYIIIDGGSTDSTIEILQRYRHKITTLISEADQGLYDAMNKGIAHATGDLVGIINADDFYFPNAFRLVSEFWQHHNSPVDAILWGDVEYQYLGRVKGFRPNKVNIGAFAPHPSMFVPLALYQKMGTYDIRFSLLADYDFMYRAYHCEKVKVLYLPQLIAFFTEGGLADSHIIECLAQERKAKIKNGGSVFLANFLYVLKRLKNLRRSRAN